MRTMQIDRQSRWLTTIAACVALVFGALVAASPAQASASTCPAGQYPASYDSNICLVAPPGMYAPFNATEPLPCPVGSFTDLGGQSSCVAAELGYFVDQVGSRMQNACPTGTYSQNTGSFTCSDAPAGSYIPTYASTLALPCPTGPGTTSLNLATTGNDSILDCFTYSANTMLEPVDNTTYSSFVPVKFVVTSGLSITAPVTITFTDPGTSTFYSYTTTDHYSYVAGLGHASIDVPMSWENTSTTFGCLGICSGSNLITEIPAGTYDVLVTTQDSANQLVSFSASAVTIADTYTLVPNMYVGHIAGDVTTNDVQGIEIEIPETPLPNSVRITLANGGTASRSTVGHSYILNITTSGWHHVDLKFDGTAATSFPSMILSEDGATITPGRWWVGVKYQDLAGNAVASGGWLAPLLISRECPAGEFSVDGIEACIPVPQGHVTDYPNVLSYDYAMATYSPTPCLVGTYQNLQGFTGSSCTDAPAGGYVATPGAAGPSSCMPGSYQPNTGQNSCILAEPGNYAIGPSATSQMPCEIGYFQPNSGEAGCLPASAGHFVPSPRTANELPCEPGTYQPNTAQGGCLPSRANYFVATVGSATQTACPVNTISAAGSDSRGDCKPKPCAVRAKSTATAKCLVLAAGKTIPAKAKVNIKVNKAHKAICKVSKSKVKTLKRGVCTVTVTVKPKKGKTVKYVVKLQAV